MGARSLGSLTLDLAVRLGAWQQGMDKAARIADKRMREIQRKAQEAGKVIGAAFTIAGGAIAAFTKQGIDYADMLGEMSQKTGLTTAELQALGNIAKKSGSSLDEIGSAIAKFNRAISEGAGSNTNKLNDQALAFQALGISIEDLKNKDTSQILDAAAKKLATFRDDANKTALEVALFGKSGADLTATLNTLGRDGLQPTIDRLAAMGVILDKETIAAADQFNDRMADASDLTFAFKTQLAEALLPTLTKLVGHFTDGSVSADKFKGSAEGLATGFRGILAVAIVLKSAVFGVARSIGALAGAAGDLFDGVNPIIASNPLLLGQQLGMNAINKREQIAENLSTAFGESTADMADAFETAAGLIAAGGEKIDAALKKNSDSAKESAGNLEELKNKQTDAAKATGADAAELKKHNEERQRAVETIQGMALGLKEQIATFGMGEEEAARYSVTLGTLAATVELGGDAALKAAEDFVVFTGQLKKARDKAANDKTFNDWLWEPKKLEQKKDELGEFAKEAAGNAQDIFADFLFDPFDKGLDGMLEGFTKMLQRMLAEAAASAILDKAFGSRGLEGALTDFALSVAGSFAGAGASTPGDPGTGLTTQLPDGSAFTPPPTPTTSKRMGTVINVNQTVVAPEGRMSRESLSQAAAAAGRGVAGALRRNT